MAAAAKKHPGDQFVVPSGKEGDIFGQYSGCPIMVGNAEQERRGHNQEKDRSGESARINLLGLHPGDKSPVDIRSQETDDPHILLGDHP